MSIDDNILLLLVLCCQCIIFCCKCNRNDQTTQNKVHSLTNRHFFLVIGKSLKCLARCDLSKKLLHACQINSIFHVRQCPIFLWRSRFQMSEMTFSFLTLYVEKIFFLFTLEAASWFWLHSWLDYRGSQKKDSFSVSD